MNCEQAIHLISAQLDREIQPEERALLEQHLHDCQDCRVTAEAFALQDHELEHTFEPRRQAVAATVAQVAVSLSSPSSSRPRRLLNWRPFLVLGGVAALFGLVFLFGWRTKPTVPPGHGPLVKSKAAFPVDHERLTPSPAPSPRPLPEAEVARNLLKVGQELHTGAGERRRVTLSDGTVVFANQLTQLRLDGERQATLSEGTVFLEVAPKATEATFVVKTPTRELTSLGTKFAVEAEPAGTGVLVTQGKVQVSGLKASLEAGQCLTSGSEQPTPAPRASHVLDWTRDLIAESETPLVPGSQYSGGALIAVDASGQQAKLSLRKYHVDVHIEDGFARTTIDQTYFNHHPWRLEGTFYFPLPPDASLSRLAMYVDGNLMEGGMSERDYANAVYQRIVSSQRDPALLEWVDGSTFKMRVFPLEGRQEKRIILSYSQRLNTLYGRSTYRFPAGHSLQVVDHWSFEAHVKKGDSLQVSSPTHPSLKIDRRNGDLVLTHKADAVKVDRDVVLDLNNPADVSRSAEVVRFARADHEKNSYLMVRFRPDLPGRMEPQRRDWVFLYESSADRDPLLARTQIEIIRSMLGQLGHDDTFTILTAGTRTRFWSPQRKPVTRDNIKSALAFLDQTHLIGALDLGQALRIAEEALSKAEQPYLVHLGSGITAIGKRQEELARSIPDNVRYIGIGVGKRWGRAMMKQAAERTGGYYTQINPDESIGWRTFDLLATLNTPRLLGVQVQANVPPGNTAPAFLCDNPAVSQGEEICAIARLGNRQAVAGQDDKVVPESLTVTGVLDGKPYQRDLPVKEVAAGADYLPRTWAKLEIDRLLTENSRDNKPAIIELSKAMYVMTPYTSLLVLENEEMYKEFHVDRGRKDHWALYACPQKIDVVYEPDPTQGIDARNAPKGRQPTRQEILQTILVRVPPALLKREGQSNRNEAFVTALQIYNGAYAIAEDRAGDSREEDMLGRLKQIVSKQERVRAQTELERLEEPPIDFPTYALKEAKPLPTSGIAGLNFTVGNERPNQNVFFRQMSLNGENSPTNESRLRAERGDHYGFLSALAFSPDGRMLVSGGDRKNLSDAIADQPGSLTPERLLEPTTALAAIPEAFLLQRTPPQEWGIAFPRPANTPGRGWQPVDLNGVRDSLFFEGIDGTSPALGLVLRDRGKLVGRPFSLAPQTQSSASPLYRRLEYTGDERLFTDLLSYAPGLNTTRADIEAVLEAEAAPQLRQAPGKVAPEARQLIEHARQAPWQTLTLGVAKNKTELRIVFDGAGRYSYERTLALGLKEQVVCDGKRLLHLYPELGLAAQRTVSRFHRAEVASLFPWLPPPAEDLAHGADLVCVNAHTVAVVPHSLKNADLAQEKPPVTYRLHLVFAPEGRLAERQWVEQPAGKALLREVHDGKGLMRLLDSDGKELAHSQARLSPAQAPQLSPDLGGLVVLQLPLRSREHVFRSLRLEPSQQLSHPNNGCYRYLGAEEAVRLLATLSAQQSGEAVLVFRHCFHEREQVRRGLFTLLAGGGQNVAAEEAFHEYVARKPNDPLIRYLALQSSQEYRYLQYRLPVNLGPAVGVESSFLQRLAVFRDLVWRWQQPQHWALSWWGRRQDEARSLAFLRQHPDSPLAVALLAYMSRGIQRPRELHDKLAEVWGSLAGPEKDYEACYEQARCLLRAGRTAQARSLFQDIYQRQAKNLLPLIDRDFRVALEQSGQTNDPWSTLMLKTAATFIERMQRPAAVVLAYQVRQLGDQPLFDNLLDLSLKGIKDDKERLQTYLPAIHYLMELNLEPKADELLQDLLNRDNFVARPRLWRLAAQLADRRGQPGQAVVCLERALNLEYRHLPEVIDLQSWRNDYRRLLDHYQSLATALVTLGNPVPDELIRKTIRAADRWRAHDPEATGACQQAANILKLLGTRELAWEYMTTPIAMRPGEGPSVDGLASNLSRTGDHDLANYAYTAATEANPNNGMLLWEQARNLRDWGKNDRADELLKQLAEKDRPQWQELKEYARWQLKR